MIQEAVSLPEPGAGAAERIEQARVAIHPPGLQSWEFSTDFAPRRERVS